jgi:hypothetical protein
MKPATRRQLFTQAAAVGAAALGTAAAATAQEGADKKPRAGGDAPPAAGKPAEQTRPRELFAVVDAAGTLLRGRHAAAVDRIDIGLYEVTFRHDVRKGVCVATVASQTDRGLPPTGYIGVQLRPRNPRTVVVSTANTLGENVNMGFHLLVFCPDGAG